MMTRELDGMPNDDRGRGGVIQDLSTIATLGPT